MRARDAFLAWAGAQVGVDEAERLWAASTAVQAWLSDTPLGGITRRGGRPINGDGDLWIALARLASLRNGLRTVQPSQIVAARCCDFDAGASAWRVRKCGWNTAGRIALDDASRAAIQAVMAYGRADEPGPGEPLLAPKPTGMPWDSAAVARMIQRGRQLAASTGVDITPPEPTGAPRAPLASVPANGRTAILVGDRTAAPAADRTGAQAHEPAGDSVQRTLVDLPAALAAAAAATRGITKHSVLAHATGMTEDDVAAAIRQMRMSGPWTGLLPDAPGPGVLILGVPASLGTAVVGDGQDDQDDQASQAGQPSADPADPASEGDRTADIPASDPASSPASGLADPASDPAGEASRTGNGTYGTPAFSPADPVDPASDDPADLDELLAQPAQGQ